MKIIIELDDVSKHINENRAKLKLKFRTVENSENEAEHLFWGMINEATKDAYDRINGAVFEKGKGNGKV